MLKDAVTEPTKDANAKKEAPCLEKKKREKMVRNTLALARLADNGRQSDLVCL